MGVLDDMMSNQKGGAFNQNEAFAAVAVVAAVADGVVSNEEVVSLQSSLLRMQLFRGWDEQQFSEMFNKLADILQAQGMDALLSAAVKTLAKELHETVFVLASDLILADGSIAVEEKDFLHNLQDLLGINDMLAKKIVEVMLIKNRG